MNELRTSRSSHVIHLHLNDYGALQMPYLLTYWYTNRVVRFTAIFIASKIPMIITIKMIYHKKQWLYKSSFSIR